MKPYNRKVRVQGVSKSIKYLLQLYDFAWMFVPKTAASSDLTPSLLIHYMPVVLPSSFLCPPSGHSIVMPYTIQTQHDGS